jgi:hypothetical protein
MFLSTNLIHITLKVKKYYFHNPPKLIKKEKFPCVSYLQKIKVVGHKSSASTDRYSHFSSEETI